MHTRATPAEIGAERLQRLERNDPDLAEVCAHAPMAGVDQAGASRFQIEGPAVDLSQAGIVEVSLALARPCALRLDAVLGAGLRVSRGDVARWWGARIVAAPGTRMRAGHIVRGGEVVRLLLPLIPAREPPMRLD